MVEQRGKHIFIRIMIMITESRKFSDKAKQFRFHEIYAEASDRQKLSDWVYLARLLHFARELGTVEGNHATVAVAKTSRESQALNNTQGGSQGFMRRMRGVGLDVNTDRKSILAIERRLEAAGVAKFTRGGNGFVAIAHLNLRAAALFLEMFHPPLDWLEEKVEGFFAWLFEFLSGVLKRAFNRLGDDTTTYDGNYYQEDLEEFDREFPTVVRCLSGFRESIRKMFERFCCRRRSPGEVGMVWWDVDLSLPE